jgi:hypothetical protein
MTDGQSTDGIKREAPDECHLCGCTEFTRSKWGTVTYGCDNCGSLAAGRRCEVIDG